MPPFGGGWAGVPTSGSGVTSWWRACSRTGSTW